MSHGHIFSLKVCPFDTSTGRTDRILTTINKQKPLTRSVYHCSISVGGNAYVSGLAVVLLWHAACLNLRSMSCFRSYSLTLWLLFVTERAKHDKRQALEYFPERERSAEGLNKLWNIIDLHH